MNRRIQVRRRKDTPVTAVYEGVTRREKLEAYEPAFYLSRIWMGVCPPENGEPGYTAVLGQIYDGVQDRREPLVRLLDEGMALDPADFSPAELKRYKIPYDNVRRPTKSRLGQAVIALKDIYWPQLCLLPPGSKGKGSDQQGAPFTAFIRKLNGLMAYDMSQGQRFFRQWWPFYSTTRRVVDGVVEVEEEDRDYNKALIDALYESQALIINEHCTIYLDERLEVAKRCVGMVLHEMEVRDVAPTMRTFEFGDGYADPVDDPDWEDDVDRDMREQEDLWAWYAGVER